MTEDKEILASKMFQLCFYASEVLELIPLLNCGFQPNQIIVLLKKYDFPLQFLYWWVHLSTANIYDQITMEL